MLQQPWNHISTTLEEFPTSEEDACMEKMENATQRWLTLSSWCWLVGESKEQVASGRSKPRVNRAASWRDLSAKQGQLEEGSRKLWVCTYPYTGCTGRVHTEHAHESRTGIRNIEIHSSWFAIRVDLPRHHYVITGCNWNSFNGNSKKIRSNW